MSDDTWSQDHEWKAYVYHVVHHPMKWYKFQYKEHRSFIGATIRYIMICEVYLAQKILYMANKNRGCT